MDSSYIKKLLECFMNIMAENREYLIELDSVVGDGDLGLTMGDGFAAAYHAVRELDEPDAGKLLYTGGKAMSTAVPSTMGTLMASGLMNAGKALRSKTELTIADIALLFDAYMEGVSARGKAKIGEKTFLDGMAPAVEVMNYAAKTGMELKQAANRAATAAQAGFDRTTTMVAVHGRAATRGEASRSLLDPGAAVAMLLMEAFAKSLDS